MRFMALILTMISWIWHQKYRKQKQNQKSATVFVLSHSVMYDSLWLHGLQPARILCPRNFPSKNTGPDCHFLLQRIFTTQESNPHLFFLLHCQADSLLLCHLEACNKWDYINFKSFWIATETINRVRKQCTKWGKTNICKPHIDNNFQNI